MHPYKLVKDVRTGHETSNVDHVMNGDLNDFIKSYLMTEGGKKMTKMEILHNPRCSKSRQALKLLIENGIDPEIFLYLKNHFLRNN